MNTEDLEDNISDGEIIRQVKFRLDGEICSCFRRLLARIIYADAWAGIMIRRKRLLSNGDLVDDEGWSKFFCHLPEGEERTDLVAIHHVLGESLQYASNDQHTQAARVVEVAVTVGDIVSAKMGRNPGEQFVLALMKTKSTKEFQDLITTTLQDLGMKVIIEKVPGGITLETKED